MTIANRVFVEAVADAVAKSGLRLTRIEHTLTSFCQMVGALGLDEERPILLVQANEQSAVMAISYQGQLLLDYRPVEHSSEGNEQIPAWARGGIPPYQMSEAISSEASLCRCR